MVSWSGMTLHNCLWVPGVFPGTPGVLLGTRVGSIATHGMLALLPEASLGLESSSCNFPDATGSAAGGPCLRRPLPG